MLLKENAKYIPLVIALIVLLIVWFKAFLFKNKIRYRLTSERFFVNVGILSRKVDELELIRVNDVTMSQTIAERMLGLGTVTVLSNDETTPTLVLKGISGPEKVKESIRNAAAKKRQAGLYVERI